MAGISTGVSLLTCSNSSSIVSGLRRWFDGGSLVDSNVGASPTGSSGIAIQNSSPVSATLGDYYQAASASAVTYASGGFPNTSSNYFTILGWFRVVDDASTGSITVVKVNSTSLANARVGLKITKFSTNFYLQRDSLIYSDPSFDGIPFSPSTWVFGGIEGNTSGSGDGYIKLFMSTGGSTYVELSDTRVNSGGAFSLNSTVELLSRDDANPGTVQVDSLAFWSRLLTSEEKSKLYNAGVGRNYTNASQELI